MAGLAINSGDTAWVLVCGVLVLMMTIPGLVLFYGGMVRRKDVLAIMMQSFIICAAVSVTWMVIGYSLDFAPGSPWLGGLSAAWLGNLASGWNQPFVLGAGSPGAQPMAIPQSVFVFFQMTFAIITPAVVTGAFADRLKFRALLLLVAWTIAVYAPVAHWVWSPQGWLHQLGLADYAGGTVVEINAGVAGLTCALLPIAGKIFKVRIYFRVFPDKTVPARSPARPPNTLYSKGGRAGERAGTDST